MGAPKPVAGVMQEFLEHLHGRATAGLVELTHSDPEDRQLRHARLYELNDLTSLVKAACEINASEKRGVPEKRNAYTGIALRKPGTERTKRASAEDVPCSWAVWIDIDDIDAITHASERWNDCPPSLRVVTAWYPTLRGQAHWLLKQPICDLEVLRAQNTALMKALDGDPMVVDPPRVMRLPGGVAWAVKPGRRDEIVGLHVPRGGPPVYSLDAIRAAFPPPPPPSPPKPLAPISTKKLSDYAAAAAVRELQALERAPRGTRNSALNKAAFSLAQLVKANALPEDWVRTRLIEHARAIGLGTDPGCGERGIVRTIQSAFSAASPRNIPQ